MSKISNINISSVDKLITPKQLKIKLPLESDVEEFVFKTRNDIKNILYDKDPRKLFIVGPCSIHNIEEAKEYGLMLTNLAMK